MTSSLKGRTFSSLKLDFYLKIGTSLSHDLDFSHLIPMTFPKFSLSSVSILNFTTLL